MAQKRPPPIPSLKDSRQATPPTDFLDWKPGQSLVVDVPAPKDPKEEGLPLTGTTGLGPTVFEGVGGEPSAATQMFKDMMPEPIEGYSPAPGAIQPPQQYRVEDVGYDPAARGGHGEIKRGWKPIPEWQLPTGDYPYGLSPNLGQISASGIMTPTQLKLQQEWEDQQEAARIEKIGRTFEGDYTGMKAYTGERGYIPGQMHPVRAWALGDRPGPLHEHIGQLLYRNASLGLRGVTGGSRYSAMWMDMLSKYVVGTIEKGIVRPLLPFVETGVDYDKQTSAQTLFKTWEDQASRFIRWQEENLPIKNRNVAENTFVQTLEFYMSLTGSREAKALLEFGQTGFRKFNDIRTGVTENQKVLRSLPVHQPETIAPLQNAAAQIEAHVGPMKKRLAAAKKGYDASPLKTLIEAEGRATNQPDLHLLSPAAASIRRLHYEINRTQANVMKDANKALKVGRSLSIIPRRYGKGTFDWEFPIASAPIQKAAMIGVEKRGGVDPISGLPRYDEVTKFKALPIDPTNFRKFNERMMLGQASTGAALWTSVWDDYTKDTRWNSYKHLAGILGVFMHPSAAFKVIEHGLDASVGAIGRLRIPLKGKPTLPGTDINAAISFPHALLFSALVINKMRGVKDNNYLRVVKEDVFDEAGKHSTVYKTIQDFPKDGGILNTSFGQKVVGWSAGLGPFGLGLDHKTMLKGSDGELLNARQVLNPKTGKMVTVGDTEFDLAMQHRAANLEGMFSYADRVAEIASKETREQFESLWQEQSRLSRELNEMNAGDMHEVFNATFEQIQRALLNQYAAGELSVVTADTKTRKNFFGWLGLSLDKELHAAYNTIRAATIESDASLKFVMDSIRRLSATDPVLQKKFEGILAPIKQTYDKLMTRQDELTTMVQNLGVSAKEVGGIEGRAILDEVIHGGRDTANGTDLGKQFGISANDVSTASRDALEKHGSTFKGLLESSEKARREYIEALHAFKNDPNSVAYKAFDISIPIPREIFDTLELMRGRNFGDDAPVLENLLSKFAGFNMQNPSQTKIHFIENLEAYGRYQTLSNPLMFQKTNPGTGEIIKKEPKELLQDLKDIATMVHNAGIPVTLNSTKITSGNRVFNIEPVIHVDGTLDITATIGKMENSFTKWAAGDREVIPPFIMGQGETVGSQIEWFRRFISNFSAETTIKGNARQKLNEIIEPQLNFHDFHALRSEMSSLVYKHRFDDIAPTAIPTVEELNKVFIDYKLPISNEAKEAWKEYMATFGSENGRLMREAFGSAYKQGKYESFELPEIIFRMPGGKAAEMLEKMFSNIPATKTSKYVDDELQVIEIAEISQIKEKEGMREVLDKAALLAMINPDKKRLVVSNRGILNMKALNEKGFLSDKVLGIIQNYKKRVSDPTSNIDIFAELKRKEGELMTLVGQVVRANEQAGRGSLFNEDFKKLPELYDYLMASSIAIERLPISTVERSSAQLTRLEKESQHTMDILEIATGAGYKDRAKLQETIERMRPKHIADIQGNRMDRFFEVVFGVKPGDTTVTALQRKRIEDFRQLMMHEMFTRSVKVTDTRQSAFGPTFNMQEASGWGRGDLNRTFFGVSPDLDLKVFAEEMGKLMPMFDKMNTLLGKSDIQKNLNNLFAAAVILKAQGPDAQAAMELLSRIPRSLTMPAMLSRVYAGLRGVVSWRYLASETMIREHQRRKAQTMYALFNDSRLQVLLLSVLEGRKLSKKDTKELRHKVKTLVGGRITVYSEDEIGMGTPKYDDEVSDESFLVALLESFNASFDIYGATSALRTRDISSGVDYEQPQTRPSGPPTDFLPPSEKEPDIEATMPQRRGLMIDPDYSMFER